MHALAQTTTDAVSAWQAQANKITIIRDNWGVPHVYGKQDADCAFGVMYTQCEDNFWQLEETFISALGRSAELYGESRLPADVSVALFECVKKAKADYASAPKLIRQLCNSAAAGINYYLYKHPDTERRLLLQYEPWYFLLPGTDNPASHGISNAAVRAYTNSIIRGEAAEGEDDGIAERENGSNTMAIAPVKSASGHSLLLINPHVNFFGNGQRYECHLISEEGLNVSGFAIFGNFYIWSGFNAHTGWAHTNSGVDFTDVYLEHFDDPAHPDHYRYGTGYRVATNWQDTLLVKTANGLQARTISLQKTHHGPVVAKKDAQLVTIRNVTAPQSRYIEQCWKMCRSKNFKTFRTAMNMRTLGYPNTMYADKNGRTAYWHGNAVPKRSTQFDWRNPVDGSNPATEWKGLHKLKDIAQVIDPATGWIQNCNSTPYMAAGVSSPKQSDYPAYMAYDKHIFRAVEAVRLLDSKDKISFEAFGQLVVSNHLPMMALWLPQILHSYDSLAQLSTDLPNRLGAVADTLRRWNYRYALNSQATTLAVMWYLQYDEWNKSRPAGAAGDDNAVDLQGNQLPMSGATAVELLDKAASALKARFGTSFINWGDINRLQRATGSPERFDDNKPSWPVAAVPSPLGSLFAFGNGQVRGQQKFYGTRGNTYTAIVEFGPRIKARSIMYFGQSANPASSHYLDQAPLYVAGKFKDAWFYREDIEKHAERTYHPGE
ncbi:penicillin acylase family protein [Paraflavitalea sp. CAU 1676]|uniref:penicillin acylase family protein n=1 Tax=Paraflavitalea sp. CAU 1676 TaxID=3032598 RepID=UPI0023DB4B30|nr:penicillin acylase family protein [Paraflavitalea sp. CAU 1676]MDF2190917.1 penicillin acylase family protein [Paraflavitalea sp. CAU 1676]